MRYLFFCLLIACTGEPAAPPPRKSAPIAPPPLPLIVHSVELDLTSASDTNAESWIRCTSGTMTDLERKFEICQSRESASLDPSRDELALILEMDHAYEARSFSARARFIKGRARLLLPLREVFATLPANTISKLTTFSVPFSVDTDFGTATGTLTLETPRVLAFLLEAKDGPLRFPSDAAPSSPPTLAYFGPEPTSLPASPRLPLSNVDLIALDVGLPRELPPCPLSRHRRTVRDLRLAVFDRRSGAYLGERLFPQEAPCDLPPTAPDKALIAQTLAEMLTRSPEPRPEEPPRETFPKASSPDLLSRLSESVLGLDERSTRDDVAAILGAPSAPTASEDLEVRRYPHAGALFSPKNGTLLELWFESPLPSKFESLDPQVKSLSSLLDGTLNEAFNMLGRPNHRGVGFGRWRFETGPLVFYLELLCPNDGPCTRIDLGWYFGPDPHDGCALDHHNHD
jgi:hypothetical protein